MRSHGAAGCTTRVSSASVRAAVAAKVATMATARHVYSADASSTVNGWPAEFTDDGPHALIARGSTSRIGNTGNQWITRSVDVVWRFSALSSGGAQRQIDALEDEIMVTFSAGLTMSGAAIDCLYTGSDAPFEEQDDNGRNWWVWVTHFAVRERYAIEMTA